MLNKFFSDISDSDKKQILLVLFITMSATILILFAFLASRGNDIDYFKMRLDIMDQRTIYMDQKVDKVNEKLSDVRKDLNDVRKKEEELSRDVEEQRKWIEYWKSLPQLPKPPHGNPQRR